MLLGLLLHEYSRLTRSHNRMCWLSRVKREPYEAQTFFENQRASTRRSGTSRLVAVCWTEDLYYPTLVHVPTRLLCVCRGTQVGLPPKYAAKPVLEHVDGLFACISYHREPSRPFNKLNSAACSSAIVISKIKLRGRSITGARQLASSVFRAHPLIQTPNKDSDSTLM